MNIVLAFDRAYWPPSGSKVDLDFVMLPGQLVPPTNWQGLRSTTGIRYGLAAAFAVNAQRMPWSLVADHIDRSWRLPSERTVGTLGAAWSLPWEMAAPMAHRLVFQWERATPLPPLEYRFIWESAPRIAASDILRWENTRREAARWMIPWHVAERLAAMPRIRWETAAKMSRRIVAAWHVPPLNRRNVSLVWERAARPAFVYPPPALMSPPLPPDNRIWIPPPGSAVPLDFMCPVERYLGGVPLPFRAYACTPRAPYLRAYIIMNSMQLIRVSDGAPIAAASIDVTADLDSWSWELTAKLRSRAALDLVAPGTGAPVAVQATINGYTFVALVEGWTESRRHGYSEWTIRGRSQSATLADPYAAAVSYEETLAYNAHQLADNEMPPTGWTLTWQTVDWLVPAGAYSYRDLTTMGALQQIAGSVGAVVQSHQSAATLIITPRYKLSPWNWAAAVPDVALTEDIIQSINSEWRPQPAYNGVYVSGTTQGVIVLVKRTGTAGDVQASMITDPLITHVDAGTERGRNILAAAGKWSLETIQIPLISSPGLPGLLLPGTLVEVSDGLATWRGQVAGVRVSGQRSDGADGRLTVAQTIDVERWYG